MVKSLLAILLTLSVAAGCTFGGSAPDPGYSVAIETQPSPMQSGRLNTITVRVKDKAERPLTGAKVTVRAEHKSMGHGGGGTVQTDEREPGVYSGGLIPPMDGKYALMVAVEGSQGKSEKSLDFEVR